MLSIYCEYVYNSLYTCQVNTHVCASAPPLVYAEWVLYVWRLHMRHVSHIYMTDTHIDISRRIYTYQTYTYIYVYTHMTYTSIYIHI